MSGVDIVHIHVVSSMSQERIMRCPGVCLVGCVSGWSLVTKVHRCFTGIEELCAQASLWSR